MTNPPTKRGWAFIDQAVMLQKYGGEEIRFLPDSGLFIKCRTDQEREVILRLLGYYDPPPPDPRLAAIERVLAETDDHTALPAAILAALDGVK